MREGVELRGREEIINVFQSLIPSTDFAHSFAHEAWDYPGVKSHHKHAFVAVWPGQTLVPPLSCTQAYFSSWSRLTDLTGLFIYCASLHNQACSPRDILRPPTPDLPVNGVGGSRGEWEEVVGWLGDWSPPNTLPNPSTRDFARVGPIVATADERAVPNTLLPSNLIRKSRGDSFGRSRGMSHSCPVSMSSRKFT